VWDFRTGTAGHFYMTSFMSSIAWPWSDVLPGVYKIRAPCYKRSLMMARAFLSCVVLCRSNLLLIPTWVRVPSWAPFGGGGGGNKLLAFYFYFYSLRLSDRIQALFFLCSAHAIYYIGVMAR
jgi:hypothetical protein